MRRSSYRTNIRLHHDSPRRRFAPIIIVILLLIGLGWVAQNNLSSKSPDKAASAIKFDKTFSETEKQAVQKAIKDQSKTFGGSVKATIKTSLESDDQALVVSAYLPVTNIYSTKQKVTKSELAETTIYVLPNAESTTKTQIADALNIKASSLRTFSDPINNTPDSSIALVPADQLSPELKLLSLEDGYYLDSFDKGAIFRQVEFTGSGASDLKGLSLNNYPTKDSTLKVNMSGVTALTRLMMKKLSAVKDPKYFSQLIGPFMADADITHVSNEVSFRSGCQYHDAVFCSPPEMIEVLKESGVDLVELTGNHNNDNGRQYNTETIKLYHELGWNTFGGGLNSTEASKPYVANKKGSRVIFLGYNYADSPGSGAIASATDAGANGFNLDKIKTDLAEAKKQANFVIVDVQFWECFAYPAGYSEFPECDLPIPNQKQVFRSLIDLGADMVIGTQAHQPQTYELYKSKPIYYGLGNMYFEQTQWPGTERGIILTHYFVKGKLIQTKLSPTVYDKALQTHLMSDSQTTTLLERLKTARENAGL